MKKLYTQEQIDEMRKRLYDRGTIANQNIRHELSDTKIDVSRDWNTSKLHKSVNTTDMRNALSSDINSDVQSEASQEILNNEIRPKRRYRTIVITVSLFLFILAVGATSLFLYFGGNQISNENIQISVVGPPIIGGGEIYSLQISVANQNSVPIESATLILKYPAGTRSVGDTPRNLFEERIPINNIASGEIQNIPITVAMFGEESADKKIEATIEYRVSGSNGMFYKDAEPLSFRISSSPLVLRVESVEKVASGQLVDVVLTVVSNTSSSLNDLIVTASYPNGFIFEESDPKPVFGQNVWKINELLPEESKTIKIKGIISGLTEERLVINLVAGPENPDNQYLVGSKLAETKMEFTIERPFIDVDVAINGISNKEVIIDEGKNSNVSIDITNTLDETVYDMVVEVMPSGNALNVDSIKSEKGFYDSNKGTVRWEVSNNESFGKVLPGDTRQLNFEVVPGPVRTTASFDLTVNVYARRIAESSAQETLIGSTKAGAKYSSNINLGSQIARNIDRFTDSGPIPPKVSESTTYTVIVAAEAGANDLANVIVETSLPVYVDWLDQYDTSGRVTYNPVSHKLQWEVGDISTGGREELLFQISIKPSISQVGTIPTILNTQSIRANDRFTGALLQDSAPAVTTELSTEMGFDRDNGEVLR